MDALPEPSNCSWTETVQKKQAHGEPLKQSPYLFAFFEAAPVSQAAETSQFAQRLRQSR